MAAAEEEQEEQTNNCRLSHLHEHLLQEVLSRLEARNHGVPEHARVLRM